MSKKIDLVHILDKDLKHVTELPDFIPVKDDASSYSLYDLYKQNKENWGDGPWQKEPDDLEFIYKNYTCKLQRNYVGCWCGYVVVPSSHPQYNALHDNSDSIDVWGDITYAQKDDNGVFWIGFDCAHYNDLWPTRNAINKFIQEMDVDTELKKTLEWCIESFNKPTYKTIDFAMDECKKIVDQLIEQEK